ncbi:uncharacterized protein LOC114271173 [Camellia sinensis]|uniref:uncharacterized protein LOC114271173 n=1 Tax=Camellia sinensis TaxID=4442 RepID=UPI001036A44D|nr:uncharacterized protein LOC114271173 [Camellia sinensis]
MCPYNGVEQVMSMDVFLIPQITYAITRPEIAFKGDTMSDFIVDDSCLSDIEALSGTNFKKWKKQIGIVLGIMDLDYVSIEPASTKPNDTSSITPTIQGAILVSESAIGYMKSIEEQFIRTSKSLASTLMIKMITMKYDGLSDVREHILKINDMASQLKGMDMEISEGFLVYFIMTSLPMQFGCFENNYNT